MSTPTSESSRPCVCLEDTSTDDSTVSPHCECPRDDHDLVVHEETCLMYRNEAIIFPHDVETCECVSPRFVDGKCHCCGCPPDLCRCRKSGREAFDEWRDNRDVGEMPAVLESTHPLMQRFQNTLKQFLMKENAIAEEEILNLKDELKLSKLSYDRDLENIYKNDHDTNAQRVMIEEYENSLPQRTAERQAAETRAKEANERYKRAKDKLEQDTLNEREAVQEIEALTTLCKQLEQWREETESGLTVSHRMSEKMRQEKKALADEKRELDMMIFALSNEVWKLESKVEMMKKQMETKNNEMETVNDKVTAYAAELEDLDLDKRRLVSLWNSVLVNITQRDKVYDSVRDDYRTLQENYRTLLQNLEITKKVLMEEMNKGKELEMNKDKLMYDLDHANKQFETEDQKRITFETQIGEMMEAIEMSERDEQLIQMENQTMRNILKSTEKDLDRKTEHKLKLENQILANIQDCLLNDKAVESMANGIKKMREMSRKQEVSLMLMENQHAKMMLDIEVHRNHQAKNKQVLEDVLAKVKQREDELNELQEKYDQRVLLLTRKQRELDIVQKKYATLKEIFDMKSPQERRIEELESQIKSLRERTEASQHEWLRLQAHVVKMAEQHQKTMADINLINKQIQICDQKLMYKQSECDFVVQEQTKVDRTLRELRGRLEVLQRTRKDSVERNQSVQRANLAITHEYAANLKGAEMEIIELEEEIEGFDKEKMNLTQELDRVQREALIWQRKGILAVELKKNMQEAKSAAGEIGQMKNEIHRMEVRREQLRRTGEKLAEDLALYVTRRETAMDKSRAAAAVEKAHGGHATSHSQSQYHHKLRLARADVARVSKDLSDTETRLKLLLQEQDRLDKEVADTTALNAQLEEQVAALMREVRDADRQKQWLLERVVRSQRLGTELSTAVKRQSVRVKKPKSAILAEYENARDLNEKLQDIVATLKKEYPHFSDRFETISNTLNIKSPSESPRLSEECQACPFDSEGSHIAEKPFCP